MARDEDEDEALATGEVKIGGDAWFDVTAESRGRVVVPIRDGRRTMAPWGEMLTHPAPDADAMLRDNTTHGPTGHHTPVFSRRDRPTDAFGWFKWAPEIPTELRTDQLLSDLASGYVPVDVRLRVTRHGSPVPVAERDGTVAFDPDDRNSMLNACRASGVVDAVCHDAQQVLENAAGKDRGNGRGNDSRRRS